MVERYNVDEEKMREGLRELMKYEVNQVLNSAGRPATLILASRSYFSTLDLVESLRIDCSEYRKKIQEFEDEINKASKLEKISKR